MKINFITTLCLTALVPTIVTSGTGCNSVTIDFAKLPGDTPLQGGEYLSNEWSKAYGLVLSAKGGYSNMPRLFDTANPGTKKRGDPDLGTPNQRCPGGGPGVGEGGEPNEPGENCEHLGNVLIIQEDNDHPEVPDDNVDGGTISFKFDYPVRIIEIGLLDIDYKSFLTVRRSDLTSSDIPVPMLGDNSAQKVKIDTDNVVQLDLNLRRSGAITHVSFCKRSTSPPSPSPTTEPTPAPTLGKGPIGSDCYDKSDCDTNSCFFGPFPPPGVCTCNVATEQGCDGDLECFGTGDILDALGIYDSPPLCFLPVGAPCSPGDSDSCLTGVCNYGTGVCGCNLQTMFPCDTENEEQCMYDRVEDGFVCKAAGDGSVGSFCFDDSDCDTKFCSFRHICTCNPFTNDGCEGDFVCSNSNELGLARGYPDATPLCKLPIGASCDLAKSDDCLTANCDDVTNECTCSLITNYPCDVNAGEKCLRNNLGYVCQVPFPIGSDCSLGSECETGACHIFTPGFSGTCSCDVDTNDGCDDGLRCYSSDAIAEVQGIDDALPWCYLPFEDPCVDDSSCLTQNCDDFLNECACNLSTDWPCIGYEQCTIASQGAYGCVEVGDGSIGSDCSQDSDCDTNYCDFGIIAPGSPGICTCDPSTNQGCEGDFECAGTDEIGDARGIADLPPECFKPVGATCDFEMAEDCITGFCDLQFSRCGCSPPTSYPCDADKGEICLLNDGRYNCGLGVDPCPEPDPTVICPTVALRVNCQGCEYVNQCRATSADAFFSKSTCFEV